MASEDAPTRAQIKKLYAVLHSLGLDPKEWKKQEGIPSFSSLSRGEISEIIEQLEESERVKKEQFANDIGNGVQKQVSKDQQQASGDEQQDSELQSSVDQLAELAELMRACVQSTKKIVEEEFSGLTETTRANLCERLSVTLFLEARRCGL